MYFGKDNETNLISVIWSIVKRREDRRKYQQHFSLTWRLRFKGNYRSDLHLITRQSTKLDGIKCYKYLKNYTFNSRLNFNTLYFPIH